MGDTFETLLQNAVGLDATEAYEAAETAYRQLLASSVAAGGPSDPKATSIHILLGRNLTRQGKHAEAVEQYRAADQNLVELFGGDHVRTLRVRMHLAKALAKVGRDDEARLHFERTIPKLEMTPEQENIDLSIGRLSFAALLEKNDRPDLAEVQYRIVLHNVVTSPEPDQDTVAMLRESLIGVLWQQRRLAESESELRSLVEHYASASDPEDPRIVSARCRLAVAARASGNLADSVRQWREVLSQCSLAPGGDERTTIRAKYGLALTLDEYSDVVAQPSVSGVKEDPTQRLKAARLLDDSERYFRAVHEALVRISGEDHPETLEVRRRLIAVAAKRGYLDDVERDLADVVREYEKVLGHSHTETVHARYDLGRALEGRGKLVNAAAEYRAVLDLQALNRESDLDNIIAVRIRLAEVELKLENYHLAETQYRAILLHQKSENRDANGEAIQAWRGLIECLQEQGRLDEAELELRAALVEYSGRADLGATQLAEMRFRLAEVLETAGKDHAAELEYRTVAEFLSEEPGGKAESELLLTKVCIAECLRRQDRLAEALIEFQDVASADPVVPYSDTRTVYAARRSVADIVAEQGHLVEAEQAYRDLLHAERSLFLLDLKEILTDRAKLARVLFLQDRVQEAEKEQRAVLHLASKILAPDDPNALRAQLSYAQILDRLDDFPGAEAAYRTLMESASPNVESEEFLGVGMQLGNLYMRQLKFVEAEQCYRNALSSFCSSSSNTHPGSLVVRYSLGTALQARGDLRAAETEYRAILAEANSSDSPDTDSQVVIQTLSSEVPIRLGQVLLQQDRNEEALTVLDEATDVLVNMRAPNESLAQVHYYASLSLFLIGQTAAAAARARLALAASDNDERRNEYRVHLAQSLAADGQCLEALDQARRAVSAARAADPTRPSVLHEAGIAAKIAGDNEFALKCTSEAYDLLLQGAEPDDPRLRDVARDLEALQSLAQEPNRN